MNEIIELREKLLKNYKNIMDTTDQIHDLLGNILGNMMEMSNVCEELINKYMKLNEENKKLLEENKKMSFYYDNL